LGILDQRFRLADEAGSLGLCCGEAGVSWAGAELLKVTVQGFAPRSPVEVGAILEAAYGSSVQLPDLTARLRVAADALNRGDIGRAKVAALALRLPNLSWLAAVRVARANSALIKYNPDEPRDAAGRWTADGGGERSPEESRSRRPANVSSQSVSPPPTTRSGPNWQRLLIPLIDPEPPGLYGGRLIQIQNGGIGDNEPPPDAEAIPEVEPDFPTQRVPQGWDTPGQRVGGLYYPPIRNPTLSDGTPWPRVTPEVILGVLSRPAGQAPSRVPREMVIFVPLDGRGPTLVGSTAVSDYAKPPGYDSVRLIGTPQVTSEGDGESEHARESVVEALRLAETNQFSEIYFNRSYTRITNRMFLSRIRPDVVGAVRPGLNLNYLYHPFEIYSPGQNQRTREAQMPISPIFRDVEGRSYKGFGWDISPYFELLKP
jgi:hypothetical protein